MTPDELDAIEARQRAATTMMDVGDVAHDDLPRVIAALREAWAEVERLRRGEEDGIFTSVVHECCERVEKAEAVIARVRALCGDATFGQVEITDLRAALDGDGPSCTCGYGGFHEPENPRCERNAR